MLMEFHDTYCIPLYYNGQVSLFWNWFHLSHQAFPYYCPTLYPRHSRIYNNLLIYFNSTWRPPRPHRRPSDWIRWYTTLEPASMYFHAPFPRRDSSETIFFPDRKWLWESLSSASAILYCWSVILFLEQYKVCVNTERLADRWVGCTFLLKLHDTILCKSCMFLCSSQFIDLADTTWWIWFKVMSTNRWKKNSRFKWRIQF